MPEERIHNLDERTVAGFGEEWQSFDQSRMAPEERQTIFEQYFGLLDFSTLPAEAEGFDLGCGSGRWAALVAPQVGRLHCIDASSEALAVARRNLGDLFNITFHHASVDAIPLEDGSQDFGYSLGVLHHVPDTAAGLRSCVAKLKPGAPFLVYLYYAFDNRPAWYRWLWRLSDVVRRSLARAPFAVRRGVSQVVALGVYLPLARAARTLERRGRRVDNWPLSYYRERSLYTMRTDALDRLGTLLEQRFTRRQIEGMLRGAGLERVTFSETMPYWCAMGYRGP